MKTERILIWAMILTIFGGFMSEAANAQNYKAGANRVEFKSENEKIIGDLYLPPNYKAGERLPAIVVGGSWTSVKEQMAGLYAKKLAESGFATLAFDHRYWGESGGAPRSFESPRAKTEDFKNAVTFLQSLPMIDRERIGGLGVCASAGYMAYAVAEDDRLKSFATVAAWLHDPSTVGVVYSGERGVERFIKAGEAARNKFRQTGEVEYVAANSNTDKAAAMFGADYYTRPTRGAIPAWKNQFAVMSWSEWLIYDALKPAANIQVPALFIHSDNSALPDNVRKFYSRMPGQKDLFWMQGSHADFYDQPPLVNKAMQIAANHFRNTLVGNPSSAATSSEEREKNCAAIEQFFARLEAMDIKGFIEVWDKKGVQEMPFSPAGFPRKLDGREAIFQQYKGLPENYTGMKFPRTIHATENPETFFVEYKGIINVKATGKPYNNDYVGIFRVKNGKIVKFTEYFNPIILQEAFGKDLQKNFNVNKE